MVAGELVAAQVSVPEVAVQEAVTAEGLGVARVLEECRLPLR